MGETGGDSRCKRILVSQSASWNERWSTSFVILEVLKYTCDLILSISNYRITEQANTFFILQQRHGHGRNKKNITSLLVRTWDTVLDSKPPPYRILHQTPHSEVYYCNCIIALILLKYITACSIETYFERRFLKYIL